MIKMAVAALHKNTALSDPNIMSDHSSLKDVVREQIMTSVSVSTA